MTCLLRSATPLSPLPIDPVLPEITRHLRTGLNLVLQASPGCGKTTRVPPALLRDLPAVGEILVLEPRRLAAKQAARRVAEELGEDVGRTVGYQFRFENVGSRETRIRFLTEGTLMRRMIGDPGLKGVGAVLLDEFHERHLHGDVAFAALVRLQRIRPIRIGVMSATLDSEEIARALGGCPIVRVDAPVFPVEIRHLPGPAAQPLPILVRQALREPGLPPGDTLVFLPGMAEIRATERALIEAGFGERSRILPLHGELSREEQDQAISRSDRPKIVLSTNVAETSLTIPGITRVIDSGLARRAHFSDWSGIASLRTRPISRASAIQRAGRAGRTAPGVCLRLYTAGELSERAPFDTPEIRRADLTQTVLEVLRLGARDPRELPWLEAPPEPALAAALAELEAMGAIARETTDPGSAASGWRATPAGLRMAGVPAHPRLARVLIEAERLGVLELAATLAAALGEGALDLMMSSGSLDARVALSSRARLPESVRRSRQQLISALGASRSPALPAPLPTPSRLSPEQRVAFSFMSGFSDRLARPRALAASIDRARSGETELLLTQGGAASVPSEALAHASEPGCDGYVVLDARDHELRARPGMAAQSRLRIAALLPIRSEWLIDLDPSPVREERVLQWDPARKRVVASERWSCGQWILSESVSDGIEDAGELELAARLLVRETLGIPPDAQPTLRAPEWIQALRTLTDPEKLESWLARLSLLLRHSAPGGLPDPATEPLWPLLSQVLRGKLSAKQLGEIDWQSELMQALPPELAARFDRALPAQITLGSGRRAVIHYPLDRPPWLESRLQDFFGMKQGPSVLDGKIPVTLHLLAPNGRAIQVTTDLPGFWKRAYADERHALSRRYPRHAWPEDPTQNLPTSGQAVPRK